MNPWNQLRTAAVLPDGTNPDIVAEDVRHVFLPKTPETFAHDGNGNLTAGGAMTYDYDDENQLIRVTKANDWKSEFAYDGKMRRRLRREYTWSTVSGSWLLAQEVRYVYSGKLVLQERDANNLPAVTYTRGPDLSGSTEGAGGIGGLLARTELSHLQSPHSYYHSDGNGNVTMLLDANQTTAARYHYDPFGNTLAKCGPLADANLYRFSSKELHPNSGLVYYLYRYYSPELQRWVNRDPIGELGGINLYRAANNNLILFFDPWGLTGKGPQGGSLRRIMDDIKTGAGICRRWCGEQFKSAGRGIRAAGSAAFRVIDLVARASEAGAGMTGIAAVRAACQACSDCQEEQECNEKDCEDVCKKCSDLQAALNKIKL